MAVNPLVYTEKVVRSFLRYQLTRFPFSDDRLYQQVRRLLRLENTRDQEGMPIFTAMTTRVVRQGGARSPGRVATR